MIKEKAHNNLLKETLKKYNKSDVVYCLNCLHELISNKEYWNDEMGFDDYEDLNKNLNDISSLQNTINLIENLIIE